MANGQMDRKGASGTVVRLGDLTDAMNFYINTFMGKDIPQKQKDAAAKLNANEKKVVKNAAREALPPKPVPRPPKNLGEVRPAPRPVSAMDAKELAGRAKERRDGSGPDSRKPSPVDTKSRNPLAKRIMEALGDPRNMAQATSDRKMTEEMERETMGRKKGGMGQKKKDSVKKAYGGMVKKKQGGSTNKVNMKAGFTRRGCSKG